MFLWVISLNTALHVSRVLSIPQGSCIVYLQNVKSPKIIKEQSISIHSVLSGGGSWQPFKSHFLRLYGKRPEVSFCCDNVLQFFWRCDWTTCPSLNTKQGLIRSSDKGICKCAKGFYTFLTTEEKKTFKNTQLKLHLNKALSI